mgnify:FL=1
MKKTSLNPLHTETYLGKLGELTLKGGNIHVFERQLVSNVHFALSGVEHSVWLQSGRLYLACPPASCKAVEFCLDHLMGITGWAKVCTIEKNITAIQKAVRDFALLAKENGARSFKIEAKREDKSFELNSYQICTEGASLVFDTGLLAVDVHHPDVVIHVEVRDSCYVYSTSRKTCRGLPVGVSGRALLLLSGGLDSPVAGWRMLGRGMKVECCYFHSYPYTSVEAQEKVETLARRLADYGLETHLNIIPFTDVQMRIKSKAPQAYTTLMLRVCMMKVANMLCERIGADCIVTGESVGQVASQTVQNLTVTEHFAKTMLLRPLCGMDKEEIVDIAVKIGTYETSILPYEDCCVLFSPKHPVLRATVEEAEEIYASLEVDELIQKSFEEREIKRFTVQDSIKNI